MMTFVFIMAGVGCFLTGFATCAVLVTPPCVQQRPFDQERD